MRLTDHDASFLNTETADTPMHGLGIAVVEGVIPFEEAFTTIAKRIHKIPQYRRKLAFVPMNLAQPVWVDDDKFDLANHVVPLALAPDSSLEDALEAALAVGESLLPRDKPLWKLLIVSGVAEKTLVVHIAHHALVDGASGVDISLVLFDIQQNPAQETDIPKWEPAPAPDLAQLAMQAIGENTQNFAKRAQQMQSFDGQGSELVRRATESVTRFISEPVMTAPWNRALVSKGRVFRVLQKPFADVRKIRNRLGGTVNDVVLSAVVEGATRYMAALDQLPNRSDVAGQHLRVMCPVSVRREDEKGALGNRVSGIFPVFDAVVKDAASRLAEVRFETENIKQNREAQAMQLLSELMPPMPPSVTGANAVFNSIGLNLSTFNPMSFFSQFMPTPNMLSNIPMAGFNFTCTNVPGVQTTQYFAGHAISQQYAVSNI